MNKIFKASIFFRATGICFKNIHFFSRNIKLASTVAKSSTKNQEADTNNIERTNKNITKHVESTSKLSKTDPEYQKVLFNAFSFLNINNFTNQLEKLFSPEFDKELEKMIAKKVEEGFFFYITIINKS